MKSKQIIKTCHWEITKKCDLNCLHCISLVGSKKELSKKSILKIIDILKDWGCEEINFTGGEPLSRKDIFNILKRVKKNKIKVGLLSNGILVNNKNIKQIKNYVDNIGISLDGASIRINDKIRGKKSFRKIINTINLIKKYKILITLYVTICELNISDFENILKLAKFLRVNSIRVNEITLRGKAYKNRNILRFSKSTQLNLKQYLLDILERNNFYGKNSLLDSSCEIDNKNIFISPLGYIYSCIEIYQQKPNCHLGNILKISKNDFKLRRNRHVKLKPKDCPYQFIVKRNFALCLNNPLTKCRFCRKL